MKLGKLAARRPVGLKELPEYLTIPLSPAPPAVKVPGIQDWQMLGNDTLGDCTFAGIAHAQDALTWDLAMHESQHHASDAQVVAAYLAYTGGQDIGADEASLLQHWRTNRLFAGKDFGYAPTALDLNTVKQVINSFGVAYIGIQCPQSAQEQFGAGQPWTVVQGSPIEGGHCIILVGYDPQYIYGVSWGKVVAIDPAFLTQYMDECWAIICPEISTKGEFHSVNLSALQADLTNVAITEEHSQMGERVDSFLMDELKRLKIPKTVEDIIRNALERFGEEELIRLLKLALHEIK